MTKTKGLLLAVAAAAAAFTVSCTSVGDTPPGNEGSGNSFSYCLISGQCLDGPFTSKECGDLGGLPSNSCTIAPSSSSPAPSSSSSAIPVSSSLVPSSSTQILSSSSIAPSSSSVALPSSSAGYGSLEYGGQRYKTVVIGTQTWMAENLNYEVGISRCYNNQESNCNTYGRLYNWETAMDLPSNCNPINSSSCQTQSKHKGICPEGWHLPTREEWGTLSRYVESNSGCSLWSCHARLLKAKSGWNSNGNGTDDYGFSALPGSGSGYDVGDYGCWWYPGDAGSNMLMMSYNSEQIGWVQASRSNSFSVRCMRD